MAQEFRLPDIGEGLTEAEIVRWLVEEGERVEADQPVVEIETDKAVVEIPSPYAGIVIRHGGAPGDIIEVGSVLLVVGDSDEEISDVEPRLPDGEELLDAQIDPWEEDVSEGRSGDAAPIVGTLSDDVEVLEPRETHTASESGTVKALPVVRKLARDNGIDLAMVNGTGPGGRITREDVQSAIDSGIAAVAAPPAPEPARETPPERIEPPREGPDQEPEPEQEVPDQAEKLAPEPSLEEREPEPEIADEAPVDESQRMSLLRRTIAANMAKSWAEIPHVTTFDEIDATRLLETRAALAQRHGTKIPLEALVIKAVIPALDAYPEFNATIDEDSLILHSSRDIGIAVDTPDGLLVAVIRDADEKRVLELAEEVVRLGKGARERTLTPDELTGQTFTVSNIGAVGGGHGTPIVPYGTTAILSVGRARAKPIVYEGDLAIAPLMPLSLSYDHRVVDGAQGRRFMALVMENIEEPALFLAT